MQEAEPSRIEATSLGDCLGFEGVPSNPQPRRARSVQRPGRKETQIKERSDEAESLAGEFPGNKQRRDSESEATRLGDREALPARKDRKMAKEVRRKGAEQREKFPYAPLVVLEQRMQRVSAAQEASQST